MFTVILSLRLMDAEKMFAQLSRTCTERKMDKMARRLCRAVESLKSMQKEIENDVKQGRMF